jgi:hypothetical protein
MNVEMKNWEENNQRYLAAALNWLRLRLTRLAHNPASMAGPVDPASPDMPVEANGSRWRFWEKNEAAAPPRALLLPAPAAPDGSIVTDEQISKAAAEMVEAEAADPPPVITVLGRNLGLSRFEREILLLCVAVEIDTRIAPLCARAQGDPHRPYPTFALAMALFEEPEWGALSPESPLRHWRLIEINQPGAQPLTTSALRADERIVNFLKGVNYLDDRLVPLLAPMSSPIDFYLAGSAPPSHQRATEAILHGLRQSGAGRPLPVIQLVGADTSSKQLVAHEVATAIGLRLYRLPAELLPAHAADLETLARLAERETALWPMAIYLDAPGSERNEPNDAPAPLINRFLARGDGVIFLDTRDVRRGLSRESLTVEVSKPTPAEQQAAWTAALGAESRETAKILAAQFNLNLQAIQQIVAGAGGHEIEGVAPADVTPHRERLWTGCLAAVRPQLDGLARRIEPKATWDDIALPETEMKLLRRLAAQVRYRGRVYEDGGFAMRRSRGLGINALFAGESGTGKTMAAEVIANDLNLNLYRIDLSAVVDKYIGETEKNLRRLFDAAEDGGVILFFDEADALFSKRTEITRSQDRYANIEINYLLQRLEDFGGLAIMATNMKNRMDSAFMRRIRFIVEFRAHGHTERRLIWQRIFPPETRTEGLDYDRLARLNLNGGSINNVAINAAFLAAQENSPVTMPLALEAARIEFLKLKRPVSEADFQWRDPKVAAA